MKGYSGWTYRPYVRATELHKAMLPQIVRLVPNAQGFAFDWIDKGCSGAHTLYYRIWQTTDEFTAQAVNGMHVMVKGLAPRQDYEFILRRDDGTGESALRLVRTGEAPGVTIQYLHPEDKVYGRAGRFLSTPSVVKLPNGRLLAALDIFGAYMGNNLTVLYASEDDGETWQYETDLFPCSWPGLFVHKGKAYILACETEFGNLMIGCSEDGGRTWKGPVRIFAGGNREDMGWHKNAVPVLEHNGRLYTGVEYGSSPDIPLGACMLSIDADADLLVAENWSCTEPLLADYHWQGMPVSSYGYYMEGNALAMPDGTVADLLRIDPLYQSSSDRNKAVILKMDSNSPDAKMSFDRVIDMPCGLRNKFCVRKDEKTGLYVGVMNEKNDRSTCRALVTLAVSEDLYHWRVVSHLMDYTHADQQMVGVQYPFWVFDGDDMIMVLRTACNRAHNFHDSNYITFHRIRNVRDLF